MPLDALRKRVYRGTIKAAKVDGQYLVDPDDLAALLEADGEPSDTGETTGETVLGRVSDKGETPSQAPELTRDFIESLKGEITFLREQLDKRSQELADERERSDVLHREAFARIEALTAGVGTMVPSDVSEATDDEPPQSDDVAPGRVEPPQVNNESFAGVPTGPRGGLSGWWARIFGR